MKDRKLNAKIRRLLQDLRTSISKAFSESSEVGDVLDRVRDEGWSLYLVVDRKCEDLKPQAFELATPKGGGEHEPHFKIDGRDLTFLRSVGIDPTRKLRRRRRSG